MTARSRRPQSKCRRFRVVRVVVVVVLPCPRFPFPIAIFFPFIPWHVTRTDSRHRFTSLVRFRDREFRGRS